MLKYHGKTVQEWWDEAPFGAFARTFGIWPSDAVEIDDDDDDDDEDEEDMEAVWASL